jgi:hypothetical protein
MMAIGGGAMTIHKSMQLVSLVAFLGLGMFAPEFAHAGCVQMEMEGTWYTFAPAMMRCKVNVNSSGSIVASKSSCSIRDETGVYSLNIGGGHLDISSACKIEGKIRLCEARCTGFKIENGRLERDKNIVVLQGYPSIDPGASMALVGIKK